MLFLLQVISILLALSLEHSLAKYIACIIPVIYIAMMGLGTFTGGNEINLEKLKEQLKPHWRHADELAHYMQRYWYALRYVTSANSRQFNCTSLSFLSAGIGFYFFLNIGMSAATFILCMSAVLLYLMAIRINRALGIFQDRKFRNSLDEKSRTEWRLATTALVAFSELFPESQNHKFLADMILDDEVGAATVKNWRLPQ